MTLTRIIGITIAVAIVWALFSCFLVVDESEQVVVTQIGRPVAVHRDAGLKFKLPVPIQRATRLDKRVLFSEVADTELLTADKKNVLVSGYLLWEIADPLKYLRTVRNRDFAEARLMTLVQSELGSKLGDLPFSDLISAEGPSDGIQSLEADILDASATLAESDYGIAIRSFGITRANFPAQNLESVFSRMRAERARIARKYRAEGEAEAKKIRAAAERKSATVLADATAEAATIRGKAEAEAAKIYADAYRGHEDFYRFVRTLESYEKALDENTTLVLPADSAFLELLTSKQGPLGQERR